MDDDGIQLNFSTENSASSFSSKAIRNKLKQKPNKPGAKLGWKQKRDATKIVAHRIKKAIQSDAPNSSNQPQQTVNSNPSGKSLVNNNSSENGQNNGNDNNTNNSNNNNKSSTGNSLPKYAKFLKSNNKKPGMGSQGPAQEQQSSKKNVSTANMSSSIFRTNPEIPTVPVMEDSPTISAPKVFPENTSFEELGVHKIICSHLSSKVNISKPTNIQRHSLPYLLDSTFRQDLIIKAQTGSGKTLAFLLPILNRLLEAEKEIGANALSRGIGTMALVLAPTRELAQQIYSNLEQLLQYTNEGEHRFKHWIVSGLVIGGDKKKAEKARIRKGVNILVSTPGRLLDHLKTTQSMKVNQVRWLILDEADRLLELGFRDTLTEILEILDGAREKDSNSIKCSLWPDKRQTILCSATIGGGVKTLAQQSLNSPVAITEDGLVVSKIDEVGAEETQQDEHKQMAMSVPSQLDQKFVLVPAKLRFVTLISYLKQLDLVTTHRDCKVIVFFSSCDSVDYHFMAIKDGWNSVDNRKDKSKGYNNRNVNDVNSEEDEDKQRDDDNESTQQLKESKPFIPSLPIYKLHGNLSQQIRSKTTQEFASSKRAILLCTDVAARGLDIPDISHIVQYDVPTDAKDYVHRAGRTARIGKTGSALLFLLPSEVNYIGVLRQLGLNIAETAMNDILSHLISSQELNQLTKKDTKSSKSRIREKEVEFRATNMQMTLERYLIQNIEAHELAKRAFTSQIRAYATHPSSLQSIFHVKRLHLGHVAKSFGLREAPGRTVVGSKGKANKKKQEVKPQDSAEFIMKRKARALLGASMDEFGDGNALRLSGIKKRRV